MIIVSQNEEVIVNFENITNIRLQDNNKGQIMANDTSNQNTYFLGIYITEERAKEVLQEIITAYTNTELIKLPKLNIKQEISSIELYKNICYKMPKE